MTKQIKRSITRFFKGFTLVELIIVIAIIAILSVTAFMTITKWIGESRDSRRLSDIGSIHRALNYNYVDQSTSEKYPLPDEAQTITGENGEILWKQGVFGTTATEETSTLTKTPEDPNGEKYEYSVTNDQETYEVYAKLENGEEISYLTDKAYAKPEKYIAKRGNYNGYIVGNTGDKYNLYNAPSIYLTTGAQLTSGTTNNIYQEGKKEDIETTITGTNINDLYNGGDVESTLKTISNNYPGITDTTKAQDIVNSAGNNTESVTTSNNDENKTGWVTYWYSDFENGNVSKSSGIAKNSDVSIIENNGSTSNSSSYDGTYSYYANSTDNNSNRLKLALNNEVVNDYKKVKIEFYVNKKSGLDYPTMVELIGSGDNDHSNDRMGLRWLQGDQNGYAMNIGKDSSNNYTFLNTNTSYGSENSWYKIVLIYDKQNKRGEIYLGGDKALEGPMKKGFESVSRAEVILSLFQRSYKSSRNNGIEAYIDNLGIYVYK